MPDEQLRPRQLDLARDILDLHIVDRDLKAVGRVDDIELGAEGGLRVTALLTGTPALAGRFHGRLGAWMRSLYKRLHDDKKAEPIRIPFSAVRHINSRITLFANADELGIGRLDRWINDTIIGRIPGADHAP